MSELRIFRIDPGMQNFFSGRDASYTPEKEVEEIVGYVRNLYSD